MLRLLEKQCEFVVCWQRMVVSGVAGTVLGWQLAENWGEIYEVERLPHPSSSPGVSIGG
jgi:hypothetical protein